MYCQHATKVGSKLLSGQECAGDPSDLVTSLDKFPMVHCMGKELSTIHIKLNLSRDYGLLILALTLIFHFGETPENGSDSRQKMSNPLGKF